MDFKCQFNNCNATVAYTDVLQHLQNHNLDKVCCWESCDEIVDCQSDLYEHLLKVHIKYNPEGCQQCGRRFAALNRLIIHHKKAHTKDFNKHMDCYCPIDNCMFSSPNLLAVQKHAYTEHVDAGFSTFNSFLFSNRVRVIFVNNKNWRQIIKQSLPDLITFDAEFCGDPLPHLPTQIAVLERHLDHNVHDFSVQLEEKENENTMQVDSPALAEKKRQNSTNFTTVTQPSRQSNPSERPRQVPQHVVDNSVDEAEIQRQINYQMKFVDFTQLIRGGYQQSDVDLVYTAVRDYVNQKHVRERYKDLSDCVTYTIQYLTGQKVDFRSNSRQSNASSTSSAKQKSSHSDVHQLRQVKREHVEQAQEHANQFAPSISHSRSNSTNHRVANAQKAQQQYPSEGNNNCYPNNNGNLNANVGVDHINVNIDVEQPSNAENYYDPHLDALGYKRVDGLINTRPVVCKMEPGEEQVVEESIVHQGDILSGIPAGFYEEEVEDEEDQEEPSSSMDPLQQSLPESNNFSESGASATSNPFGQSTGTVVGQNVTEFLKNIFMKVDQAKKLGAFPTNVNSEGSYGSNLNSDGDIDLRALPRDTDFRGGLNQQEDGLGQQQGRVNQQQVRTNQQSLDMNRKKDNIPAHNQLQQQILDEFDQTLSSSVTSPPNPRAKSHNGSLLPQRDGVSNLPQLDDVPHGLNVKLGIQDDESGYQEQERNNGYGDMEIDYSQDSLQDSSQVSGKVSSQDSVQIIDEVPQDPLDYMKKFRDYTGQKSSNVLTNSNQTRLGSSLGSKLLQNSGKPLMYQKGLERRVFYSERRPITSYKDRRRRCHRQYEYDSGNDRHYSCDSDDRKYSDSGSGRYRDRFAEHNRRFYERKEFRRESDRKQKSKGGEDNRKKVSIEGRKDQEKHGDDGKEDEGTSEGTANDVLKASLRLRIQYPRADHITDFINKQDERSRKISMTRISSSRSSSNSSESSRVISAQGHNRRSTSTESTRQRRRRRSISNDSRSHRRREDSSGSSQRTYYRRRSRSRSSYNRHRRSTSTSSTERDHTKRRSSSRTSSRNKGSERRTETPISDDDKISKLRKAAESVPGSSYRVDKSVVLPAVSSEEEMPVGVPLQRNLITINVNNDSYTMERAARADRLALPKNQDVNKDKTALIVYGSYSGTEKQFRNFVNTFGRCSVVQIKPVRSNMASFFCQFKDPKMAYKLFLR
ncbi:unnamed protein product [Bursaphelenchus okinawaensis]|uniref:C2H2-type domain-containing protein n=1 Tax=Bursaphelenchus okinawaensis TaxID=465554 RepID=A0A811LI66_9BILA|nr:unnamed protein product [Bursaphelenchus okinawaensis]CAG9124225.1 unnamed protein product [Bursaphelenchus okinawaensis]